MICYRDMTFCNYWRDCDKSDKCGRALTDGIMAEAKLWWRGEYPPICAFSEKPECHSLFETKGV